MNERRITRTLDEAQDVVSAPTGPPQHVDDTVKRLAKEYLDTQSLSSKITARLTELKKTLSDVADKEGFEDDKGHRWYSAGDLQLKREKRVSTSFDAASAEEWAKAKGIWDDVKMTVEVLDVDKLLALAWTDRSYTADIEAFNTQKVTWAFKVVEGKLYDEP
jgi:hypothetical protein